jgi:hypothetical protein
MDLPVWQALFEELADTNFVPITVAFESRGVEAARPWIEAAKSTYPSLIDRSHLVADLYGMVNVPIATWIDEEGRIVRPPEPAGTNDGFRAMDHETYAMPQEARDSTAAVRRAYLDALRDWARKGSESRFALSGDEVRRRLAAPNEDHARATTLVRLGEYLWNAGWPDDARAVLTDAEQLWPESWAIKRQAWNLEHPLKSGGPEFWAAVDALEDDPYYAPLQDIAPSH